MSLIKCVNAAFGYESTVAAENVTFSVERGDCLYIVGENGAGKSTLIKGLVGLAKPISGKVTYGDGLTSKKIGYMPQKTEIQRDFPTSVYEVVTSGCVGRAGLRPFYSRADRERVCEAMTALRIHDIERESYRELSGGQQQRVLLARALVAADDILLLDEPAAGLDPVVTAELYGVIADLNKKRGVTVITVSHDMDAAVTYATHILHMKKTPLFFGTRDEYLASDLWREYGNGGVS